MRARFPFTVAVDEKGWASIPTPFPESDDDKHDVVEANRVAVQVEVQVRMLRAARSLRSERSKRGHAMRKARLANP